MVLNTLDTLSIVIDFALLIWFAYTYRRTLGTRFNKYMKILIAAIVLSLVNKIFLGGQHIGFGCGGRNDCRCDISI